MVRYRLVDRILATEGGGVCLISVPPGYGSTTVLAQVADRTTDHVRWLSLDASLADDQAYDLLMSSVGARSDGAGVDEVLDTIADAGQVWLIVDGLSAQQHPRTTALLRLLAGRLPGSARLAISTQGRMAGPPRANRLTEADLALDDDDAVDLVIGLEPGLAMEATSAMIQAAEGWIGALVAGAKHARSPGGSRWLQNEGAAILLGDWFAALPLEQQRFLDRTAVLDLLSAGLAEAVCEDPGAPQVLLNLDTAHAYLQPVEPPAGHTGRWWRRHGLLSAFLRMRLSAGSVRRHSLAADWFVEKSDIDSAMHHLIAAGRPGDAGELLTRHESELLSGGHADRVLDWYGRIPSTGDDRILRLLRIGWGQVLTSDVRGAVGTLGQLKVEWAEQRRRTDESSLEEVSGATSPGGSWSAEISLLTAYLAACHADPSTMVAQGLRAMDAPQEARTRDANQIAPLLVMRGYLWSGQPEAAEGVLESIADMPFANDMIREAQLNSLQGLLDAVQGRVHRAGTRVTAALTWLERAGLGTSVPSHYTPLQADALFTLESGDAIGGIDKANRAIEAAKAGHHVGEMVWALSTLARAQIVLGDFGAAKRTLTRAGEAARAECPETAMSAVLDQLHALASISSGDILRAERIIRQMRPSDQRALLWARAGLARQPGLARRALDSVKGTSPRTQAQKHLLLAAVHRSASRRMAQGHLREAAQVAHKHGMAQLLYPAIPGILDLARETALEEQDDNLRWLLGPRPSDHREAPADSWAASLSRGELQLVTLLPSRAKNAEIAQILGVSVNTVKTRLRRLYAKLEASNRDEAIFKAREQGLIE